MYVRTCVMVLAVSLAACSDYDVEYDTSYDELAPYYEDRIIADYPEEMADYRDAFDAAAMPIAIAQGEVGRTSVFDSKFLGTPYMPKDFEYPHDPDGRALSFLAQINFDDVPPLPDYPESGILQFYISDAVRSRRQVWGLEHTSTEPYDAKAQFELQQKQNFFRVVWHEEVIEDETALSSQDHRRAGSVLPISDEAKLTFEAGTGYPVPGDYRFDKIFGADGYEFFDRFGEESESVYVRYTSHIGIRSIAWIGGYAFFTQWDPRYADPDEDWLLLLEIQSSTSLDQPEVMWGDAGIGAFFIRRSDLLKRDFSRVLYHWDNH